MRWSKSIQPERRGDPHINPPPTPLRQPIPAATTPKKRLPPSSAPPPEGLKAPEGGLKAPEGGLKAQEGGLKAQEGGLKAPEGKQSEQPPIKGTGLGKKIRHFGGTLLVVAAAILWNHMMSKIDEYIDAKIMNYQINEEMKKLELIITADINNKQYLLADLQLKNPNKPLFTNIEIHIIREGHYEDDGGVSLLVTGFQFVSSSFGIEAKDKIERTNIKAGNWFYYFPKQYISIIYSIPTQPFNKNELREILANKIIEEELTFELKSSNPKGLSASQQHRNTLLKQLEQLDKQ